MFRICREYSSYSLPSLSISTQFHYYQLLYFFANIHNLRVGKSIGRVFSYSTFVYHSWVQWFSIHLNYHWLFIHIIEGRVNSYLCVFSYLTDSIIQSVSPFLVHSVVISFHSFVHIHDWGAGEFIFRVFSYST